VLGHGGVVDPVRAIQKGDPWILDPERLVLVAGRKSGRALDLEVNPVARAGDSKV
jgi:hypothetical protein